MRTGTPAYIGLGSNLGDREAHLRRAVEALAATPGVQVVGKGRVIETAPVGPPGQGPYLNSAVAVHTTLDPRSLRDKCHQIEAELGRDRSGPRWGPRTIDLDLLLYADAVIATEELTVPHPQLAERRFVLEPLADIAADVVHPGLGRTIGELYAARLAEDAAEGGLDALGERLRAKLDCVKVRIQELGSVAVAYSGGTDSTFLAYLAHEVLGERMLAVMAASALQPGFEAAVAQELARRYGWRYEVLRFRPLDVDEIRANPPKRCYHCKRGLFARLYEVARTHGLDHVADGANADDVADFRPGDRAAAEAGVARPLRDCDLSKAEVRALSRALGLATADRPASACLASRVPYGTPLTEELLARIDAAEQAVRELGVKQVRVRAEGRTARLEVAPGRIGPLATRLRGEVVRAVQAAGFAHVALDLAGYRTGSLNEGLSETDRTG